MKCPRCQHKVRINDKYCKNCGRMLPVKMVKDARRKRLIILLSLVVIMNILSMRYVSRYINETSESNTISEYNGETSARIVGVYDYETFIHSYENGKSLLENTVKYVKSLEGTYDTKLDTSYSISVYSNNNLYVHITCTGDYKGDTLKIERYYTRDKQMDIIQVSLTRSADTFEKLRMDDQKEFILTFMSKTDFASLISKFNDLEKDYEEEKITHYGLGSYIGHHSLILYKQDKGWISIYSTEIEGDYSLTKGM